MKLFCRFMKWLGFADGAAYEQSFKNRIMSPEFPGVFIPNKDEELKSTQDALETRQQQADSYYRSYISMHDIAEKMVKALRVIVMTDNPHNNTHRIAREALKEYESRTK